MNYTTTKVRKIGEVLTRKIPRLSLVDIDIGDGMESETSAADFPAEIVAHQFLVRGVESEARREHIGRALLLPGDGDFHLGLRIWVEFEMKEA